MRGCPASRHGIQFQCRRVDTLLELEAGAVVVSKVALRIPAVDPRRVKLPLKRLFRFLRRPGSDLLDFILETELRLSLEEGRRNLRALVVDDDVAVAVVCTDRASKPILEDRRIRREAEECSDRVSRLGLEVGFFIRRVLTEECSDRASKLWPDDTGFRDFRVSVEERESRFLGFRLPLLLRVALLSRTFLRPDTGDTPRWGETADLVRRGMTPPPTLAAADPATDRRPATGDAARRVAAGDTPRRPATGDTPRRPTGDGARRGAVRGAELDRTDDADDDAAAAAAAFMVDLPPAPEARRGIRRPAPTELDRAAGAEVEVEVEAEAVDETDDFLGMVNGVAGLLRVFDVVEVAEVVVLVLGLQGVVVVVVVDDDDVDALVADADADERPPPDDSIFIL